VVAASQHLHDQIAELRTRSRALESALGALHYERQGLAHPLLCRDSDFSDDDGERDDDAHTLSQGVAVLHLSTTDGMQRFFGSVQLLRGAVAASPLGGLAPLPPVLDRCIRLFPFPTPPGTREQAVIALRSYLPDRAHAEQLLHTACDSFVFQAPAVEKQMVFNELLPGLYDARLACPASGVSHQEQGDSPRTFALFYALLAQGVLLDTTNPARESHATVFARLSLAGLGAISIFESPSYMSVLALFMHSVYHMLRHQELSYRGRCFNNLALQIALQVSFGVLQRFLTVTKAVRYRWDYVCAYPPSKLFRILIFMHSS
jgi:hypothetical protein